METSRLQKTERQSLAEIYRQKVRRAQSLDITQKQAADRSRSQNTTKQKVETGQERTKVKAAKSNPIPVTAGSEKLRSDGNGLGRASAPKQKLVKSSSTGSPKLTAERVTNMRSSKTHANSLDVSKTQLEPGAVEKEHPNLGGRRVQNTSIYSSLPRPSKTRQPPKTPQSPTQKVGDFDAPTRFLSLLGPSPSEQRRESLNTGLEEGRFLKGGRCQSPSPVPSQRKTIRASNTAPVASVGKTASSLPRRTKAATAPLPLVRKSPGKPVDELKRSIGPSERKNVTTIRIGPKKKPSCGFLVMAADLRCRDTGGGVGELVSSEVLVKCSEKGLAATWLQLKEEIETAMGKKPETGAGQYKDLALMLQVGAGSSLISSN